MADSTEKIKQEIIDAIEDLRWHGKKGLEALQEIKDEVNDWISILEAEIKRGETK